jgi:hypothetical protein
MIMKLTSFASIFEYAFAGRPPAVDASAIRRVSGLFTAIRGYRLQIVFWALWFSFGSYAVMAQSPSPDAGKSADKKMNGLLVYGQGFMFSATEPDGWHGDTDEIARYYKVNLIFMPENKLSRSQHVNIRVRVNRKETTDPSQDMETDMSEYRAQYPKVEFGDLAVVHPKYKISAKLFYVDGDFYEYVVYVDPGPGINKMFSVVMSKDSKPATPAELQTFQAVLKSLVWVSGSIDVK